MHFDCLEIAAMQSRGRERLRSTQMAASLKIYHDASLCTDASQPAFMPFIEVGSIVCKPDNLRLI